MYMTRQEKDRRTALLIQQNGLCALCSQHVPTAKRMPYIKEQNAILCKRCGMFRSVLLAAAKHGLTPQALTTFHAKKPAPDPSSIPEPDPIPAPETKTTRKIKLSAEQLEAREIVVTGQIPGMTLEDWERRAGVFGTDYTEQYGL